MTARPQKKKPGRVILPLRALFFILVAVLSLACGCSTFNRAWREAGKQPASPDTIEGRWEGSWVSEKNGHKGQLLCLMSRYPNGDCAARFLATYLKVLRFSYTVNLEVEEHDGAWYFHGEEDLGKLAGGIYQYAGRATRSEFHSTYRSKYDRGVFEMRRISGDQSSGQ